MKLNFVKYALPTALVFLVSCGEVPEPEREDPKSVTILTPTISPPQPQKNSKETNPERPEELTELDLTLPETSASKGDEKQNFSEQQVLPNLFDKKQEKKLGLGVNVVSERTQGHYLDSVVGAEIVIKIPTD